RNRLVRRWHLGVVDDEVTMPVGQAATIAHDGKRDTRESGEWRDVLVHATSPFPRRWSWLSCCSAVMVRFPASSAIASGSALDSALTVTLTVGANVPPLVPPPPKPRIM